MQTNINQDCKTTKLSDVLNTHLLKHGEKINKSRLTLISLFILALCKIQSVSFHKLANAFDSVSKSSSSLRRVQRFIGGFELCGNLIARLIFSLLPQKIQLLLVIDRTNWKFGGQNINIFMLGVAYRGVAFPLLFLVLNKKGNSNSEERIALLSRFIKLFGTDCIDCVMGDKEFVGGKWIKFLNENKIQYHIAIRKNFKVFLPRKAQEVPVTWLFQTLEINEIKHYEHIVKVNGQYCYLSAILTKKEGKPELLILISYKKDLQSLIKYKQRWQIECCFKAMKSSGFDLENTHLTDLKRIEKLLLLIMIAFTWCYKVGDYLDKEVEAIPIKNHGHMAKSVFKYGLEYIANTLLNNKNNNFNQALQKIVM